jgi:hypothetical protein
MARMKRAMTKEREQAYGLSQAKTARQAALDVIALSASRSESGRLSALWPVRDSLGRGGAA